MLLFAVLTVAAIGIAGSRPADDEGTAPWVLQAAGYVCGAVAGVLVATARTPDGAAGAAGRPGGLLLPAVLALVLVDVAVADSGGPDIGAGFLRLLLLAVVAGATLRLWRTAAVGSGGR